MFINILIVTNIVLNVFFCLVLGLVAFSMIKQRHDVKKMQNMIDKELKWNTCFQF